MAPAESPGNSQLISKSPDMFEFTGSASGRSLLNESSFAAYGTKWVETLRLGWNNVAAGSVGKLSHAGSNVTRQAQHLAAKHTYPSKTWIHCCPWCSPSNTAGFSEWVVRLFHVFGRCSEFAKRYMSYQECNGRICYSRVLICFALKHTFKGAVTVSTNFAVTRCVGSP